MSTFGAMNARIADELNRSDLSSQINLAIKSAISHYEPEHFWHNQARVQAATVDGQEYYALPSNFVSMDKLKITVDSSTYALVQRNVDYIDRRYVPSTNYTAQPVDFCVVEEQFRLSPIPDDSYTLELSYTASYDDLSATSDTNIWMTKGERLVRFRAKSDLYANYLRDPAMAQLMKAQEAEELEKIRERTVNYYGTSEIKPYL